MKHDNRSPFTLGMEIEQFTAAVGERARSYTMNNNRGSLTSWHDDMSGPRETTLGPYKNAKSILNRWFTDTRDEDITWDWHASHNSAGAGSHVHLCVADDVFDDTLEAWTIAYNTCIELTPFFAPYFCHNWEEGFRDGTNYSGGRLNVERWASGNTTRFSTSSVEDRVANPRRYGRDYSSVTFNGATSEGKPLTIEFRLNDAHPAMALYGLLGIRRAAGRAIEGGWSPKLEDHTATLNRCYDKIYHRSTEVGLMAAMQEPIEGGITFKEGRGLPGIDQREFDTMFEVLQKLENQCSRSPGSWRYRAQRLALSGRDAFGPQNNPNAIWHTDAPKGEFAWENGPSLDPEQDPADYMETADGRAVAADGGDH